MACVKHQFEQECLAKASSKVLWRIELEKVEETEKNCEQNDTLRHVEHYIHRLLKVAHFFEKVNAERDWHFCRLVNQIGLVLFVADFEEGLPDALLCIRIQLHRQFDLVRISDNLSLILRHVPSRILNTRDRVKEEKAMYKAIFLCIKLEVGELFLAILERFNEHGHVNQISLIVGQVQLKERIRLV